MPGSAPPAPERVAPSARPDPTRASIGDRRVGSAAALDAAPVGAGSVMLPEPAAGAAAGLAEALGCTVTLGDVLHRRGHRDAEAARRFLEPRLADLTRPDAMAGRAVAASRLASALRAGEPIALFGDYDCDGMTATALLTEALRALGGRVTPLLASRFDGGYGVSAEAGRRIQASGARLLVTLDCGSSDHATLGPLRDAGLDVIVIDHHLVPDEPLPALAFLNPHRPECGFPYKGLASVGLAFSVAAAVRAELGRNLDLHALLDLVAVGTIADVAPLTGDNRALVRAGLARLREATRPGFRALGELAKLDALSPVTGETVAFRLAPRLNAPGRLGPPDLALELLLARTHEDARGLAARLEQLTLERRALTQRLHDEAVAEIEREGWAGRPALVVGREGWSHGIVGIVAGRLVERYGVPVVVVGFEGGRGRASVRGPEGARLHDALTSIASELDRFGGHQAAAGLEIRIERLARLRERFEEAIAAQGAPRPDAAAARQGELVWFHGAEDPVRVLGDLERLEPCGAGNPAPQLVFAVTVQGARSVKGDHLKLELTLADGRRLSGFGPGLGAEASGLAGRATLVGQLRRDSWRNDGSVELTVQRVLPAG